MPIKLKTSNMKNKYNLMIIAAAMGIISLYNSDIVNEPLKIVERKKPVFFDRMPANFKKVRQHINIDIDYEKLPARNEIRLIGRVNSAHLASEILDYKWTLKDNLILKKGSPNGKINLRDSNEVTIDVAIKNMNKKINVRLEANIVERNIKLGGVKSFTYDPTTKDQVKEELQMKAQSKSIDETLTKERALEKELYAPRKISTQQ